MLADHTTVVVSGTKLADEIGISRSAVWRSVEHLRELGVAIAGHPRTGYQLREVPDLLLAEFLDPALRGTIFRGKVRHYFRAGSTNVLAMQAGAAGESEGTVFVAEEQTAGRGRGGHSWESAKSAGIYCSALLRPQLSPADALPLSLAAGMATAAAVASATGLQPDLRWPNDLLLGGRKFCGILTEMNAEATRVRYAVVGIGINVNQERFGGELAAIATSIRQESGRAWSRLELCGALLKSLDREYRALLENGPQDVIARFEQRSSYAKGKRVRVEEGSGFEGVTDGLDPRGFLRVQTADGPRIVLSGGVREI
ncbi:MAG TPA: biotin--[acetyl-CoA-carboxylase] ligase [Terriglobales bacterium]|nr:biotin--[acetyl-CoA-carboxylase] ligase [Terriglobales bacterium]